MLSVTIVHIYYILAKPALYIYSMAGLSPEKGSRDKHCKTLEWTLGPKVPFVNLHSTFRKFVCEKKEEEAEGGG